jgi:ubiquitin carboxyl-terminal hydrolase 9/24
MKAQYLSLLFLLQKLNIFWGFLIALDLFCLFLRLWGEPVNLREQHDALEFFNSLVDSSDEALKVLGHPTVLSKVLGGSFSDQKICQGCPHR